MKMNLNNISKLSPAERDSELTRFASTRKLTAPRKLSQMEKFILDFTTIAGIKRNYLNNQTND